MAFAVVGEQQPVIQGTVKGFASSIKPELMGLIAGILATPQDQDVCIRLDNQKVVKMFNDIVVNRRRASVRAKLRCDYAVEWAIVARICSERTGSTTVEWVKGHRGDKWNVAAEEVAKEAQAVVGKEWEVRAENQDDLRYTPALIPLNICSSETTPISLHSLCFRFAGLAASKWPDGLETSRWEK
ncbi:hypothetical protein K457DRAFT_13307 [Linnemannia elongata AG-77]|uniref:RNase H type-1 domain-containing protein n=1 Tax=Linnemannia elongata AG-77 TaxID=1314771 RepID=A0A197KCF6_9FUNG|nr:hypothetical protein K457DRAFT_13307 [Linnemannia elongata AG-77]